jgi:hypothetical protein
MTGRAAFYTLFRHAIIPYLRGFQSDGRHADVQARAKENAGAIAHSGRDICAQRVNGLGHSVGSR